MSKKIVFPLLIIYLFLFNYEICQDFDQDTMKAIACISLIKKIDNQNMDQRLISGYMISCFASIDDSKVQKLIENQMSNDISLDKDEIDKLTDFTSFQSKYSSNEIKDFSIRLNAALEKLKNQGFGGDKASPSQGRKDSSSKKSSENAGLFEFMINNLIDLFNPKDSFLFLVIFFLLVYFGLKGLRKMLGNKKLIIKKRGKKN